MADFHSAGIARLKLPVLNLATESTYLCNPLEIDTEKSVRSDLNLTENETSFQT
jgi:hypothetical protein